MPMRGRACRKSIGNGCGRFPARRGCWMGGCLPAMAVLPEGIWTIFWKMFRRGRRGLIALTLFAVSLVGAGDAQLVLCGHTHIPRVVVRDGVVIVNPGSVGMPAYDDDRPVAHVMEAGCPPRYALVTPSSSGWRVDLRAVPYDFEAAARQAEQAGRPEIAFGVRTGRMPY